MRSTFGKTSLSSLYESLYIFGKQQKFARSFIHHQELEEAPEGDAKTPLSSALQNQKAKGFADVSFFFFGMLLCSWDILRMLWLIWPSKLQPQEQQWNGSYKFWMCFCIFESFAWRPPDRHKWSTWLVEFVLEWKNEDVFFFMWKVSMARSHDWIFQGCTIKDWTT